MKPLAYPIFRWLLLANLFSEIGTWMQYIGAEWLITSQTLDPLQVSLLGVAFSMPVFLFAIPSGIWADTFGRRNVLLVAQLCMVGIAVVTLLLLRMNALGPWALIVLTFFLYSGITLQEPALHAVYPEVVPRHDLPAAVALHSVNFNLARVIGPALAGMVISKLGLQAAFIANILSFAGLIWFLWVWKAGRKTEHCAEDFGSAFKTAVNHVRSSRDLRVTLVFAFLNGFLSVATYVLLQILVRSTLHLASDGYGLLFSCTGMGAVLGSAIAAPALSAFTATRVLSGGMLLSSISIFALSRASRPIEAGLFLVATGIGGAITYTAIIAIAQSRLTDQARGRMMGIYLMVFAGGSTTGSAAFGWLARATGVGPALAIASGCLLLLAALALVSRLRMVSEKEVQQTANLFADARSPAIAGLGHGED